MKTLLSVVALCIPQLLFAQSSSTDSTASHAPKRELLGFGWLFTDDLMGDDRDRWQTASLNFSWIIGRGWQGELPSGFGDLIEIRAYSQMISPENLVVPNPNDRRYAGIIALGAHTYFARGGFLYALGLEVSETGHQDGVDGLQTDFHELIGSTPPSQAILDNQIPNGFHPVAMAEIAREYDLGESILFRPFGEARVGDESLARIGFDFTLGQVGRSELLVRDKITGHRYRTMRSGPSGWSFVVGADAAYVADSIYLPQTSEISVQHQRYRVRLGLNWEGKRGSLFYGLTHLSREFESQRQPQVVGSLNFKISF